MASRVHTLRSLIICAGALLLAAIAGPTQSGAATAALPSASGDGPGVIAALVSQPPEPVDPTPLDGDTEYLINQASGLQADLDGGSTAIGANVALNTRSFSTLSQRWAMTRVPDGNWLISNVQDGLCLDSQTAGAVTWVVQDNCGVGIRTQEWSFSYIDNGYGTIDNAGTGLALDVLNSGTTPGSELVETPIVGSPTQSQSWLYRPTEFRGNDSSLAEKAEYDRVARNSTSAPWWHDAYLPGQDLLQIFKDNGLNMIRVRPASINTTVVHNGISFTLTAAPYNNYTLAAPPASQIIPATVNSSAPGGVSSGEHAQTDWSAIDLAERAKELGMSVELTLFYSGDNTSETPGNWAGKTVAQLAGVPPTPGLMYDYVKQEMEMYRAMGAWPDLVSIGNEVNDGMFNTTGSGGLSPSGTNCTPNATGGGGTSNCFPLIQKAAIQAILDAASDTSDPSLLGAPLPPPLICIHVDGNPDLQSFFAGAVQTNGIPINVACESYYPGWHGPLTQAQQSWHACNLVGSCGSTVQHTAEADFAAEANGIGLPIFTIEDGVSYTTAGSPQDPYYGINPPGPSRDLSRQGMIDLNKVEENIPNHLSMGMEWWAGEATSISGITANESFWSTAGIELFDASTTAGSPLDNASLPVMEAMGGRLDPTLPYKFVNASNDGVLETEGASTAPGATLGTGPNTGITGTQEEWQILAQGANPEQNAAVYPAAMDHRGDGFFQIVNMNQGNGLNVLDTNGASASGSPVVQDPESANIFATSATNANQEWDVLQEGNCGDVPANCTSPPLVGDGEGDYYMIVNKATGMVLAASGSGTDASIQEQAPAAPSNGDWMVPANAGQLWRIIPARITQALVNTSPGATVSGQLSLSVGGSPSFGTFTPGVAADYQTSTTADVVSTAQNATLSVTDTSPVATGHLVNGTFSLAQPLQVSATSAAGLGGAFAALGSTPLAVLTYSSPVSNDAVTILFSQPIAATDPLRAGTYSKTLTITLSTATL